jgi:hypothetical protein
VPPPQFDDCTSYEEYFDKDSGFITVTLSYTKKFYCFKSNSNFIIEEPGVTAQKSTDMSFYFNYERYENALAISNNEGNYKTQFKISKDISKEQNSISFNIYFYPKNGNYIILGNYEGDVNGWFGDDSYFDTIVIPGHKNCNVILSTENDIKVYGQFTQEALKSAEGYTFQAFEINSFELVKPNDADKDHPQIGKVHIKVTWQTSTVFPNVHFYLKKGFISYDSVSNNDVKNYSHARTSPSVLQFLKKN